MSKMADYNEILRDIEGNPIPQIYDEASQSFVPYRVMEYAGKPGDTKPTGAPVGAHYIEIDAATNTVNVYLYDGENWVMI